MPVMLGLGWGGKAAVQHQHHRPHHHHHTISRLCGRWSSCQSLPTLLLFVSVAFLAAWHGPSVWWPHDNSHHQLYRQQQQQQQHPDGGGGGGGQGSLRYVSSSAVGSHRQSAVAGSKRPPPRFHVCPLVPALLNSLNGTTTTATGGGAGQVDGGEEEGAEGRDAKAALYALMADICDRPPAARLAAGGVSRRRGVVYTGSSQHFGNLLLSLYSLRVYHRSTLTAEVWTPPEDVEECRTRLAQPIIDASSSKDGGEGGEQDGGDGGGDAVTCRALPEGVTGWLAKMAAIKGSSYHDVLYLDSDSVPATRDPAWLFDTPEYRHKGAVFWPDYWGEGCRDYSHEAGIFTAATPTNPIYRHKVAGLQFKEEWDFAQEMETGQLLIDKHRLSDLLDIVAMLTQPGSYWQKCLYGDKDAFRFAWLFMRQPFHYVRQPPGHTGHIIDKDGALQRNGIAQYYHGPPTAPQEGTVTAAAAAAAGETSSSSSSSFSSSSPPVVVFLHQHTMKDPQALARVAYPDPSKRPYTWTYCARLHPDYFVWGIDLRPGEFVVSGYDGMHLTQGIAMFDFARKHGYFN